MMLFPENRALFEGIYNNLETTYLELKWVVLRHIFRAKIVRIQANGDDPFWDPYYTIHVMPAHNIVHSKFALEGSQTYYYRIDGDTVIFYKGYDKDIIHDNLLSVPERIDLLRIHREMWSEKLDEIINE